MLRNILQKLATFCVEKRGLRDGFMTPFSRHARARTHSNALREREAAAAGSLSSRLTQSFPLTCEDLQWDKTNQR